MKKTIPKNQRKTHVRDQLKRMIRNGFQEGQRLDGERDLAAKLGVCRVTLRGVLAEFERAGWLERHHGAGTYIRTRNFSRRRVTHARIAIIGARNYQDLPGWDYRKEMLLGLLGNASRLGSECVILSMDRLEQSQQINDPTTMKQFDAVVSLGLDDPQLLARLAYMNRGPVVLLDGHIRGLPITLVVEGAFAGMHELTRHLLALGHRRIAFIDCFNRQFNNPEKFNGYSAALAAAGIPLDESLVAVPLAEDGLYDAEPFGKYDLDAFVHSAVDRLLELPDAPTAIIGYDDGRAVPAICRLEARGYRVGKNFSVAGFGDQAIRRGWRGDMTSSRIYPRIMGRLSLDAALERNGPREGRTIFVPTRLCIRRTTCPLVEANKLSVKHSHAI